MAAFLVLFVQFFNPSALRADAPQPSFKIATGGWHHATNPGVIIIRMSLASIGWNDDSLKEADLTFTSATGGTTSGDYKGSFTFTVTNGIAWKISFGNGSSWVANSGEPPPASNAPAVETLTPTQSDKVPAR